MRMDCQIKKEERQIKRDWPMELWQKENKRSFSELYMNYKVKINDNRLREEMSKTLIVVVEVMFILGAAYLAFMILTKDISYQVKVRFSIFISQHIYMFALVIIYYQSDNDDLFHKIQEIVIFCFGNFVQFAGAEIYLLTKNNIQSSELNTMTEKHDIGVMTYIYFYYQLNIYFGVFTIFSIFTYLLFLIHEKRRNEKMDKVLLKLEEREQMARGNEDPCSICLGEFELDQFFYRLNCAHCYHKQCLKEWFKQKLNCPLCRNSSFLQEQQQRE